MRRKNDHYTEEETTRILTVTLLNLVNEIGGVVLECCAGEGYMSLPLLDCDRVSGVVTNDINSAFHIDVVSDARNPEAECWQQYSYDWVVTNPPYSDAHAILANALKNADRGVAFLLRQTYDEPTLERGRWLREHADMMRYRIPINPRPEWRKGEINLKTGKEYTTDSVTNAWFVWDKQWSWKAIGVRCPFQFITGWRDLSPEQVKLWTSTKK